MPLMQSPYVGKPVNVPDHLVARFEKSGYVIVGGAGKPDAGSDEGKASKRRRIKE